MLHTENEFITRLRLFHAETGKPSVYYTCELTTIDSISSKWYWD